MAITLLAKLEKTDDGQKILAFFASALGCPIPTLVVKMYEYMPPEVIAGICDTDNDGTSSPPMQTGHEELKQYAEARIAEMKALIPGLWVESGNSPKLPLAEHISYQLSTHIGQELEILFAGEKSAMQSLGTVRTMFLRWLNSPLISPFGALRAYMLDFCSRFEPACRHLDALSKYPPSNFWEEFHAVAWDAESRDFAEADAKLIFQINSGAWSYLNHPIIQEILDIRNLQSEPSNIFFALIVRFLAESAKNRGAEAYAKHLISKASEWDPDLGMEAFFKALFNFIHENPPGIITQIGALLRMFEIWMAPILAAEEKKEALCAPALSP